MRLMVGAQHISAAWKAVDTGVYVYGVEPECSDGDLLHCVPDCVQADSMCCARTSRPSNKTASIKHN